MDFKKTVKAQQSIHNGISIRFPTEVVRLLNIKPHEVVTIEADEKTRIIKVRCGELKWLRIRASKIVRNDAKIVIVGAKNI